MPLFGPPNIEKMEARRDVKGLIKALSYPNDPGIGRDAAKALGQIGDTQAVEPLIAALKDSYYSDVRKAVAEALGKIGDARAAAPLVAVLDDHYVRENAREGLVKIGSPAVELLIGALKDRDRSIRIEAATALGEIRDSRAVKSLLAALRERDWEVRKTAANALERIGWQPGQDEDGAYYWINKSLSRCIDLGALAVQPLLQTLKLEPDKDARVNIIQALGEIGDARAVPVLISLLGRDQAYDIPGLAEQALLQIGSPAVVPLIKVLQYVDMDAEARYHATHALGRLGDPRAIEPLLAALQDSHAQIGKEAALALEKLGWQPGHDQQAARYWVDKQNWAKCIEIGSPAVEPLIEALKIDTNEVHQGATYALGEIRDARAVEPLIRWLNRSEITAVEALGKIGSPDAVAALVKAASAYGRVTDTVALHEYWSALTQALRRLYQSGQLSEEAKGAILSLQQDITQKKHLDEHGYSHLDRGSRTCHDDEISYHDDYRFEGLDFPL